MVQSPGIYADKQCEVIVIRKIPYLILLILLLLCMTARADAATLSSKAGAVTTAGGALNVRSKPSAGGNVIASVKKGSYITLLERNGAWWRVEYAAGKYGYCHADYITIVHGTPVTVNTASGSLNIRNGPGTGYPKIGSAARGSIVLFLKEENGWSRILYGGTKTGWVSAGYLSNFFRQISLSVPNFKQMDSRWADTQIGNSGKTFAQIGCATTAISMVESQRTDTTIYPNTMAKQLRYTPSGDVYWPGHYQTVTAYSLASIYEKLKQGRPVLLGATNAYGSQHWVVITGFTGGTALNAAKFTIHDPGSHTRINLGHFFSAYPNFYKYFYYS